MAQLNLPLNKNDVLNMVNTIVYESEYHGIIM